MVNHLEIFLIIGNESQTTNKLNRIAMIKNRKIFIVRRETITYPTAVIPANINARVQNILEVYKGYTCFLLPIQIAPSINNTSIVS